MKNVVLAAAAVFGVLSSGSSAQAATFSGFTETADIFFDGSAELDYDPFFLGGAITEPNLVLNLTFAASLSTGSLLLTEGIAPFGAVLEGSLDDTALNVDSGSGVDTIAMLFSLTTGSTDYAIATFAGDLDGMGATDFFVDGVFFEPGSLQIVGATKDQAAVVPLPAGLPLLLTGIGALAVMRRRQF